MVFLVLTAMVAAASAQEPDKRHVTPVKPETNQVKSPPKGTDEKIIQQYISGDSTAAINEARKLADISDNREIELLSLQTGESGLLTNPSVKAFADFLGDIGQVRFWAVDLSLWNMEP